MTEAELRDLLSVGREQRNVEFKTGGARDDKAFFVLVARAMMALANTKDGGWVVLGVEDKTLAIEGLTVAQLGTWTHDTLADSIKEYAAPFIDFDVAKVDIESKTCLVIRVREFESTPVLCVKDYPAKLRRGGCYVRTRHKPQSCEVPTETDMRELISLAAEKELRAFLRSASRAGVDLAQLRSSPTEFDLEDFEMVKTPSLLLEKLLERGYWKFNFRPLEYRAERLELLGLRPLLEELRVRLRGWDFPHDNQRNDVEIGKDWVQYSGQFGHHIDVWRFHQTGHLIYFRSMWEDWQDQVHPPIFSGETPPGWKPGRELSVAGAVYTYSEATEFAAAFASKVTGGSPVAMGIRLQGLKGRELRSDPQQGWPLSGKVAAIPAWTSASVLSNAELLANARSIARKLLRELFVRFGWDVNDETLLGWQDALLK